jgi:hypothetical protein
VVYAQEVIGALRPWFKTLPSLLVSALSRILKPRASSGRPLHNSAAIPRGIW